MPASYRRQVGQPLYREGQRIAFKLGAFGIYRLQCRIQLTDLCLIDRGIGDTGPVNGDRAVAGDNPINGRQRRGLVSIERRVPVMRVLVIVVNDRRLAPFVNRVTAVVYAAAAVLRQVAVGGNDAGVMSNAPVMRSTILPPARIRAPIPSETSLSRVSVPLSVRSRKLL